MTANLADELIAAATRARAGSHSPHSGFAVGAAARDDGDRVFTGANVENASYTLGLCAERVTLFHAITHGAGDIVEVAIVTDADEPVTPCGACRQILWEFAPRAGLILATLSGKVQLTTVAAMLPGAFDDGALGGGSG